MVKCQSNKEISVARRQLLKHLRELNFGRIEKLQIVNGQPVLAPMPRSIVEFKPGSDNAPRPESRDYLLKRQVTELFDYFDRMVNGTIDVLEVKHGLPFKLEHADSAA